MPPMITKPMSFFDKGEMDHKYQVFKEQTQAILEEESSADEHGDDH